MKEEHGEIGHINALVRDHDSVITAFGVHDRVVAFMPQALHLYARVDHKWGLALPTVQQILTVAKKDQGVKGSWTLVRYKAWADGSSTDYEFRRIEK